jgi:hypothetical protein
MSRSKSNKDISARRRRKQEKGLPWAYILPAIVVIIIIIAAAYVETRNGVTTTSILTPGTLNFPFQCLPSESLFMHIHVWLRIVINGQNISIPGAIGIENAVPEGSSTWGEVYGGGSASCFEPIHTHDASGIIHMESPTDTNYTLGDFFNVWNQTYAYSLINGTKHPIVFTPSDILGYTTNSSYKIALLVDGKLSTLSDYRQLVLDTLAYCDASDTQTTSPCYPTASGTPEWNGGASAYPYGTGHTIVLEYGPASSVG